MTAKIIDGKAVANTLLDQVKQSIQSRTKQGLRPPQLDVILVGDDAASQSYVSIKEKTCAKVGIISRCHHFPESTTEQMLKETIDQLNHNPTTDGILLQLPLPTAINSTSLLDSINPKKDVDGFHPYNVGMLATRQPTFRPCTPFGIMRLLESIPTDIAGKHAVIVGASNIVGRPMAQEMLIAKATVTICHRFTQNLGQLIQSADILISAIGKIGVIQSDWIKPGAIVIDVGFNRDSNGNICGDIDFNTASQRAGWISPVPGGVGPMTVATLMENTLLAAENH